MLSGLGARLALNQERILDDKVRAALHRGRNLTVTTRLGDVDVVQRLPGVPSYATLEAESVGVELFEVPFRVCSRGHLIAMKRARSSALDLADLERLTDASQESA